MSYVTCLGDKSTCSIVLSSGSAFIVVVAGSTKTSTIPGISLAGSTPEETLYTPTLDVEYLVAGKPLTLPVIPATPQGIPTPALITRAVVEATSTPTLIVDAGCMYTPRIPHVKLEGARPGGRIDVEPGLSVEESIKLFEYARMLGRIIARHRELIVLAETIPGGTTTATAILEALGFRAIGRTSSSAPVNPLEVKKSVVDKALRRIRSAKLVRNPIAIAGLIGDPVHIALAGLAYGVLESSVNLVLGGGTQMAAVLAILSKLGVDVCKRVVIATTKWIVEDTSSDILGLVRDTAPCVPIVYSNVSFRDAPYRGLRMYEEGYVKEGVGAGAALTIALSIYRLSTEELLRIIYDEYRGVICGRKDAC